MLFPPHQQDEPVPIVDGVYFEPSAAAGRTFGDPEFFLSGSTDIIGLAFPFGITFPEGVKAGHHGVFGGELTPVVYKAQINDKAKIGLVIRKIRGKQEIRERKFIKRQCDPPISLRRPSD